MNGWVVRGLSLLLPLGSIAVVGNDFLLGQQRAIAQPAPAIDSPELPESSSIARPPGPYVLQLSDVATEFPLSLEQVRFEPGPLTDSVQGQRRPYRPDQPPYLNGEPSHLVYQFQVPSPAAGIAVPPGTLKIYSVNGLRAMYAGYRQELQAMNQVINGLRTILTQRPFYINRPIGVLPPVSGDEVLRSQMEYLRFGEGSGLRFVGVYKYDVSPILSNELVYIFQGLTTDGRYYVSLSQPLLTSVLPATAPLTADQYDAFVADYETYLRRVAQQLNMQDSSGFFPNLTLLDSLVRSLRIQPQ
ncbi:hypothetical protein [Leptolyngbya sp. O-77]|uniref:hypothetical protein n=1 Tax=Leptolyngbya sp. O-77 TaxID=1080068 RepID=UPI00074D2BF8|nr:hypothetical protein [Leptolyngbya sp. O-77]BAU42853.1 hypothetical protein O77CONTIG1_02675 [Leptolyngbya sp. O-77]